MTSTLGLTLNKAPFALIPTSAATTYNKIVLTRKVNIAAAGAADPSYEKRSVTLLVIDTLDKELICNAILEFKDACQATRLNLTTGADRYTKFREILEEPFRTDFDSAREGQPNSVAGFNATLTIFLSYHFQSTDLIDQKNYLDRVKKPYKMTVELLASRLRKLNALMSLLPGANGDEPYEDDDLKVIFFKMMLSDWQLSFLQGGNDITDDAYTFQHLVRFMAIQETSYNAIQERKRQAPGGSMGPPTGKRARGRGGRRGRGGGRSATGCANDQGGRGRGGRGGGRASGGGNCPFHPGLHDWEACFANPHGANYRPNFRPVVPGSQRGQGYRRAQDVQMAEADDDEVVPMNDNVDQGEVEPATDFVTIRMGTKFRINIGLTTSVCPTSGVITPNDVHIQWMMFTL
jgi:uncharacterized membrane protein YgcG